MQRLSGFQNGLIAVYARFLAAANTGGPNEFKQNAMRCDVGVCYAPVVVAPRRLVDKI
jgi:hypothetical protein